MAFFPDISVISYEKLFNKEWTRYFETEETVTWDEKYYTMLRDFHEEFSNFLVSSVRQFFFYWQIYAIFLTCVLVVIGIRKSLRYLRTMKFREKANSEIRIEAEKVPLDATRDIEIVSKDVDDDEVHIDESFVVTCSNLRSKLDVETTISRDNDLAKSLIECLIFFVAFWLLIVYLTIWERKVSRILLNFGHSVREHDNERESSSISSATTIVAAETVNETNDFLSKNSIDSNEADHDDKVECTIVISGVDAGYTENPEKSEIQKTSDGILENKKNYNESSKSHSNIINIDDKMYDENLSITMKSQNSSELANFPTEMDFKITPNDEVETILETIISTLANPEESNFPENNENSREFMENIENSGNFVENIENSGNFVKDIENSENFMESIENFGKFVENIENSGNFSKNMENSGNSVEKSGESLSMIIDQQNGEFAVSENSEKFRSTRNDASPENLENSHRTIENNSDTIVTNESIVRTDSKHRFRSLSNDDRTVSNDEYVVVARRGGSVSPTFRNNNNKQRSTYNVRSKIPTPSSSAHGTIQRSTKIDDSVTDAANQIRSALLRKLREVWKDHPRDITESFEPSNRSNFHDSMIDPKTPEVVSRIPLPRKSPRDRQSQ